MQEKRNVQVIYKNKAVEINLEGVVSLVIYNKYHICVIVGDGTLDICEPVCCKTSKKGLKITTSTGEKIIFKYF